MGSLRQLLTGLSYLRIFGEGKLLVDLGAPFVLAAITLWAFLSSDSASLLTIDSGLVPMLNGLLQVLFAFFVASLAAVATFPSRSMEQIAIGLRHKGKPLVRRRFLCYLFGYLSVLSLFLYLIGVAAILSRPMLGKLAAEWPMLRPAAAACYLLAFWNLVTVTLLGLHYLMDRVHRADPTVNKPSPATVPASDE